jgi:hypothetical protein
MSGNAHGSTSRALIYGLGTDDPGETVDGYDLSMPKRSNIAR